MKYKLLFFIIFAFLNSCLDANNVKFQKDNIILDKFSNNGFALIYDELLFEQKIISKKINERDLIIFQKNLKRGTSVKITNPSNGKSTIAKVGKNAAYPKFNNSVISLRISNNLELDDEEPYILIEEIRENSTFLAKKFKKFKVEKKVEGKAPKKNIRINDLND